MSSRSALLVVATFILVAGTTRADEFGKFGRDATPDEVTSWDISVGPDGTGLPPGSGTAKQGEAVYVAKCLVCHGEKGMGALALPLAGGIGTIGQPNHRQFLALCHDHF